MNIYKPCGIISGRELHYYLHLLCLTVTSFAVMLNLLILLSYTYTSLHLYIVILYDKFSLL